MSDETTLLPCPFCGGKAALHMSWMGDGYRYRAVKCVECGATTPGNYSEVGDQSAWDWNTRSTHGTLTAEQVREAAKSNSRQYESPVDDGVWIREYDWQAIADELNARAERTCEPTEEWCCDHCGADLIECNVGVAAGGGAYELDPPILVNYCPNCGAKVRYE